MILLTSQEREENERLMKIEVDYINNELDKLNQNSNWNMFISRSGGSDIAGFFMGHGIKVNVFEYVSSEIPLKDILNELTFPPNIIFTNDFAMSKIFGKDISNDKYLIFWSEAKWYFIKIT